MRHLWRVELRSPVEIGNTAEQLSNWADNISAEMSIVFKGNNTLAEFAKAHSLIHYREDKTIAINEEERVMLLLHLDPALTLRKLP